MGQDDATRMLEMRTIAVVGLSSDPAEPSLGVAGYLKRHGYRVVPVNPKETRVLGEPAYPDLGSVPEPVDVVNVFRRPEATPEIVREAAAIGAKGVWLQEGIASAEAERLAREAGLLFVQDRCIRSSHRMRGTPDS
jgi:predicted CoA-binding protein